MTRRRSLLGLVVSLLLLLPVIASATQRVVDLTASDGTQLKGTFFPAAKPGPGVLLLHQCNRERKSWDPLAQELVAAGFNVMTLDLRGFGESGGKPFAQYTPQEARTEPAKWPGDIDLAYRYLISQPGVNKDAIGVGGASCGVNNSVQTAIRHPEVKSLVLLSGPVNLKGREFLRTSKTAPEFFAAADDDEFPGMVTVTEWEYNITANPGKKYVHEATGGHGAEMFTAHPELMAQITDWLMKTPGHAPASRDTFQPSEEVRLLSLIDEPGGAEKVSQSLDEARKKDPKANLFQENTVNLIGYELLQAGDPQAAVEVMKLNVKAYPNSPNAYDSLADAYLAAGQKELAVENSRKALKMLASDTADPQQRRDAIKASSEARLKQLGETAQ